MNYLIRCYYYEPDAPNEEAVLEIEDWFNTREEATSYGRRFIEHWERYSPFYRIYRVVLEQVEVGYD